PGARKRRDQGRDHRGRHPPCVLLGLAKFDVRAQHRPQGLRPARVEDLMRRPIVFRHCEERSDEAIQFAFWLWIASAAAPARNDELTTIRPNRFRSENPGAWR